MKRQVVKLAGTFLAAAGVTTGVLAVVLLVLVLIGAHEGLLIG